MAVDWSNLEHNILEYIAENWLLSLEDYVAFSSVCSSWHQAATGVKPNFTPVPWLLLSEKEESKCKHEGLHKRNLFSLVSNKCYNVSLPQALGNKRCIGTGSGWILTVGLDRDFHLFNPLTKTQLDLPSEIPELAYRFGRKDSDDDDLTGEWYRDNLIQRALVVEFKGELLVLITYHDIYQYVAVARPGDAIWTDPKISSVVDATYSAKLGLILFPKDEGEVCSWDFHDLITNNNNTSTIIMKPLLLDYPPTPAPTPDEDNQLESQVTTYLLESFNGDLLIVQRYAEHAIVDYENSDKVVYKDNRIVDFLAYQNDIENEKWTYETYYFDVYKFDLDNKVWEEMDDDDLGNMALFVGNGPATCVDTKTFPTLKRNSIYFNDDATRYFWKTTVDGLGGRDMRVFDVATGSFESFYHGDDYLSSHSPPVWFLPQVSDLPKSYRTTQL